MEILKIEDLTPHPRNAEFFDDMTGEKWNEFLESVKSRGVIEPIVITPDKVIVSGHQRVRACKELGIDEITCDVHLYNNEDEILQDLLETNIRQRGDVGGSAKKVGKRIKELERIYGIRNGSANEKGNNRIGEPNNSVDQKSQHDLATQMGISVDTLQNYKLLADMIPELSDLVDTGIVTKTTALAIMKELSEEEQIELIDSLDTTRKITGREIQEYIDKNKELETANQEKENRINKLNGKINDLDSKVEDLERELEDRPEKITRVIPEDYEKTKSDLSAAQIDYKFLEKQYNAKVKELNELKDQIRAENEKLPEEKFKEKLKNETIFFCGEVAEFVKKMGGYIWITEYLNQLPEYEKKSYLSAISAVDGWAQSLMQNINE